MAMVIGNEACTSGLAKELFDKRVSELPGGALPVGFDATYMKKMCYADAYAYVTHWKNNMDITGVNSTVASGIACAVDPGTHIGATTGTGAGTQNNTVHPN